MLEIKNLRAQVGEKEILRGIDLRVGAGEVHSGRHELGDVHRAAE